MQKSATEIFESPQSVLYNFEHIFKTVFSSPLIEMFYCETSIERVSHKARFNINWLCCAVESFLVAERHVNDNKLFIH